MEYADTFFLFGVWSWPAQREKRGWANSGSETHKFFSGKQYPPRLNVYYLGLGNPLGFYRYYPVCRDHDSAHYDNERQF